MVIIELSYDFYKCSNYLVSLSDGRFVVLLSYKLINVQVERGRKLFVNGVVLDLMDLSIIYNYWWSGSCDTLVKWMVG